MRRTRVGSINERFAQRFEVDSVTGCWNWSGRTNKKGYGLIAGELNGRRYAEKGQSILAHRASWILHRGDIPEGAGAHGTVVMHKCDNPACVNPDHLILGTQAENVLDMIAKGRKVTVVHSGLSHWKSACKTQEEVEFICSQIGKTKEIAEKLGIDVSTIKRIRSRNGFGSSTPEKFNANKLSREAIEHIRSTPPGTRGLAKLYGVGRAAIANARKGLTYKMLSDLKE